MALGEVNWVKCRWCGNTFKEASGVSKQGKFYNPLNPFSSAAYCSMKCYNEANGGGSAQSARSAASNEQQSEAVALAKIQRDTAKAQLKAAEAQEEAERKEETRRKEAAHKEAIQNIKEFEFPDDDSFSKVASRFVDDYCECHPGLFADKDYKNAYTRRIQKELKILKDSNSANYEKLQSLWDEAQDAMKKKLRIRLIISGVIMLAVGIVFGILFSRDDGNFFGGFGVGLMLGAIIASLPHTSIGKTKTEDE